MMKALCVVLILTMTFLGALASFYFKKASNNSSIINIAFDINLYAGGVLYVVAALMNIYVLKYLDYSVVLPLTSVTYIWTMFFSSRFLDEGINSRKIIGMLAIVFGAIVIVL